jgi:hypothetical protein
VSARGSRESLLYRARATIDVHARALQPYGSPQKMLLRG